LKKDYVQKKTEYNVPTHNEQHQLICVHLSSYVAGYYKYDVILTKFDLILSICLSFPQMLTHYTGLKAQCGQLHTFYLEIFPLYLNYVY